MENNRVPKVGEVWGYSGGLPVVLNRDDVGWLTSGKASRAWYYVSGPSDAPVPKADVCAWPGCGLPQSFAGHNGCGKQLHMCDTVACHYFTGAPVSRITQAAVADELEKRAKDIPSAAAAATGVHQSTEAARGGEAAVSRADTMAGCTESDMRPNWPALTHAGCSRSVACNVCVPPVQRAPWVPSVDEFDLLPDANR